LELPTIIEMENKLVHAARALDPQLEAHQMCLESLPRAIEMNGELENIRKMLKLKKIIQIERVKLENQMAEMKRRTLGSSSYSF